MISIAQRRLTRELEDISQNYRDSFQVTNMSDNLLIWEVSFRGAEGTLYANEPYTLQFKFDSSYPIEAPEVTFRGQVPCHHHIYSNGYICLSILYSGWTASMRVSSVVLSIISMLSSAKQKTKPVNDQAFSSSNRYSSPKQVNWVFEDDSC